LKTASTTTGLGRWRRCIESTKETMAPEGAMGMTSLMTLLNVVVLACTASK